MPKIENYLGLNLRGRSAGVLKLKCELSDECRNRKNKTDRSLYINLDKRIYHCFHCDKKGQIDKYVAEREYREPTARWHDLSPRGVDIFKSRGISERVIIRNKIKEANRFNKSWIAWPYFNASHTKPVNHKYRCVDGKEFGQDADAMPVMYNLHEWADKEEVVIVEGEFDVNACNEAEIWNATTLPGGAINEKDENIDGKLQGLYNCYQYFANKKKVILFCDKDGPGKRLQFELSIKIGSYRVYIVECPDDCKDANDVLLKHGSVVLRALIENAKPIPISGVHYAGDMLEVMMHSFRNGKPKGDTTHFTAVDELYRWKKGNVNLHTGYPNHGKTFLLLQLMLVKSMYNGWKWAVFSPENFPPEDFYDDLVEMFTGKHVDDRYGNKMSEAEYENAIAFLNDHIFFVYPEEDHKLSSVHDRFKSLIIKHGIDGVLIDPWNQLDNEQGSLRDDQYISMQLKHCKRFALEYHVSYNIIGHPKMIIIPPGAEWPIPDVYNMAGGAMWANKADDITVTHRPKWHIDKRDPEVLFITQKIKRKRTGGEPGQTALVLDYRTMRYTEISSGKTPCDMFRAETFKDMQDMQEGATEEVPTRSQLPVQHQFNTYESRREQRNDKSSEFVDEDLPF